MYFSEGTSSSYDMITGNREPRFETDLANVAHIDNSYPVMIDFEDLCDNSYICQASNRT